MSDEYLYGERTAPLHPLYEGGFEHSARAVTVAAGHFELNPFSVLYYPGSSTDASLARIGGIRTIHADQLLEPEAIDAFAAIGSEAHRVDVHNWRPPVEPDMVALINPSDIDIPRTLKASKLRENGLVLWAAIGLPTILQEAQDTQLVGVIAFDQEGQVSVDSKDLDDYFIIKEFDSLTDEERYDFLCRVESIIKELQDATELEGDDLYRTIYDSLGIPSNHSYLVNSGYNFLHKKVGSFFVYRYGSFQDKES